MEFQDDLAGGTVLVRPALQSPDYVTGVSGWAVMIDGSAEFNDVLIRGSTSVGGTSLYYDGTPAAGNLLVSIDGTGGTDPYGNTYVKGLGVYSSSGTIQALGSEFSVTGGNGSAVNIITGDLAGQATVDLVPRDLVGTVWGSASVFTTLGASDRPGLALSSPYADTNPVMSTVTLFGGGPTTSDTSILVNAGRVSVNNDLQVFGEITDYSTWGTFTPVWNNVGTAVFSRNLGWYKRIGDMWFFEIYAAANTAGSGTTNVTISGLPFNPFRAGAGAATTRQSITGHFAAVAAGTNSSVSGVGAALVLAGGAASTIDNLSGPTAISMRGENISATFIATMQGWMRAA